PGERGTRKDRRGRSYRRLLLASSPLASRLTWAALRAARRQECLRHIDRKSLYRFASPPGTMLAFPRERLP
ncbi:MAG: hypothetical protein ACSLFQ_19555, partial [Thermoanaerobaculia bacterium]